MNLLRSFFFLLLFSSPLLWSQNFEGVLTFRITGEGRSQTFEYYTKGKQIRMEFEQSPGVTMVILVETTSGRVTMLMPQSSMYMEMNLNQLPPSQELPANIDLKKTGKTETILGYPCEQVMIRQGERTAELWVTKGLGAFVQSSVNPRSQSAVMKTIERELTSQGYFPLRMVTRTNNKEELRTEVVTVTKKSLSSELFGIPAGYQKMQVPPQQ